MEKADYFLYDYTYDVTQDQNMYCMWRKIPSFT
jgi:hypothetical protein